MKGSSLYGKLSLNRGGYKNMPDGRSTSSPFQKNGDDDLKKKKKGFPSETKKPRDFEKEKAVINIGDEIGFLNEDYHNHGKISKAQYDAKMKILRAKEKAAIEANKLR